jgi:hypothetical protein
MLHALQVVKVSVTYAWMYLVLPVLPPLVTDACNPASESAVPYIRRTQQVARRAVSFLLLAQYSPYAVLDWHASTESQPCW